MGVDAVVIVENKNNLSLEQFINYLQADEWGDRAISSLNLDAIEEDDTVVKNGWAEFAWKDNAYFAWIQAPRFAYLGYGEPNWDNDDPTLNNTVQITFLKIMLVIKKVSGGDIFLGNDVVHHATPKQATTAGDSFWLPASLDDVFPNWETVENVSVEDPYLVR